ncbi:MAG: HIT family protein [Acholeplasmataceae bacterium]
MCVFCEALKDQRRIIAENERAFAIYDRYPVQEGHALIMPKRHVESFFDLEQEEVNDLFALAKKVRTSIDRKHHPDGYNLGINDGVHSGQTVMHVHLHLIPRYRGDVPDPTGGVRGVIPAKRTYGDRK